MTNKQEFNQEAFGLTIPNKTYYLNPYNNLKYELLKHLIGEKDKQWQLIIALADNLLDEDKTISKQLFTDNGIFDIISSGHYFTVKEFINKWKDCYEQPNC